MDGMREDAVSFEGANALRAGRNRYRTFGHDGPLYEVLSLDRETARIRVIDTGEELDYSVVKALADPMAD